MEINANVDIFIVILIDYHSITNANLIINRVVNRNLKDRWSRFIMERSLKSDTLSINTNKANIYHVHNKKDKLYLKF